MPQPSKKGTAPVTPTVAGVSQVESRVKKDTTGGLAWYFFCTCLEETMVPPSDRLELLNFCIALAPAAREALDNVARYVEEGERA